jgi:hypothetical protein
MTTTEILTTAQIKAHDLATYEMLIEKTRAANSMDWKLHKLHEEAGDSKIQPAGTRSYTQRVWQMTDQEAFDIVRALAADPRANYRHNNGEDHGDSFYAYIGQKAQEMLNDVINTQDKIKNLAASIRTQEEVFIEQGWSRFEAVPGGHIHNRNVGCHTLRPTTRVFWVHTLSGDTEADAVAQYGPALCTHCFRGAPVEWVQQAKVQKTTDNRGEVQILTLDEAKKIADKKAADKKIREDKKALKEARALARAAR